MRYLVIPVLAALLLTGMTFFVTENPEAAVPSSHGAYGTAVSRGFPVPYSLTFCCGVANGVSLLPTRTFYSRSGLLVDLAVWLAISFACSAVFGRRALLAGLAAGGAVTLLTLLLRPISSVVPGYGAETEVLRPMGFPYQFLTYYRTGLGLVTFSGYEFNPSAVVADYALWAGVALAVAGAALALRGRRLRVLPTTLSAKQKPEISRGDGGEGPRLAREDSAAAARWKD